METSPKWPPATSTIAHIDALAVQPRPRFDRSSPHALVIENGADYPMGTLLECMRYAGAAIRIRPHEETEKIYPVATTYQWEALALVIYCPRGVNFPIWARMNIARMKTFGLKAYARKAPAKGKLIDCRA